MASVKKEIGVCLVVGHDETGRVLVDALLNANRRLHARIVAVVGGAEGAAKHTQEFIDTEIAPFHLDAQSVPRAFATLQEAFEWDEGATESKSASIDAVVIASPKATHYDYALAALQAGKAVFCQSPLALSVEQVQELIEKRAAKHANSVVLLGLHKRYDSDFENLKQRLITGVCGRAELIRIISRVPSVTEQPQSTRDTVYNHLYHDLDLLLWLLETKGEGEEEELLNPVQLHATRKTVPGAAGGVVDTILVVSKHANEELAMLEWSQGITYGFDQRVEVFGSKGALHAENNATSTVAYSGSYPEGQFLPPSPVERVQRYQKAYAREVNHFLTLIAEQRQDPAVAERTARHLNRVLQVTRFAEAIVAAVESTEAVAQKVLSGALTAGQEAGVIIESLEAFPVLKGPEAGALKQQADRESVRHKDLKLGAPKRLCLVGAGRMGGIRAVDIAQHPGARLSYLVDIDTKRAGDIAAKYGGEVVSQVDDALKTGDVDGVWIAVGTRQHYDVIKRSSEAGLPIYCEKPIALDQNEVVLSYQVAASHNVPLLCGWNRRFDPHFTSVTNKAKKDVDSFGGVVGITSTSGDYPTPPPEFLIQLGSIFHDLMVHDIDLVMHTVGALPTSVMTIANTFTAGLKEKNAEQKENDRVVDTAVVLLKFAQKGITALLMARRHNPQGYDQRLEVLSNKGLLLAASNPLKTTYSLASGAGRQVDSMPFTFEDRYAASYKAELEKFLEVVNDNDAKKVAGAAVGDGDDSARAVCQRGLEEALGVAHVCDAALKSQRTGKEVFLVQKTLN
eukprot:TRINITY_DN9502_c0_g1_i1.p1 TRINITY_DN9502_c0_g1~~TRINITY_DN9502_c0_g1_i1.p1  ORF type:complete len:794 (-),score=149.94 TRINITY_DN9502_c0_g1_i1:72-2453(-)